MDLPDYAIEAQGLVKTYAATKTTPAKTPAVSQVLAAGHTMILAKKVGATVTTVSAGRK